MALNNLRAIILILSFCLIYNEEIQISNYEEIIIPKGETFTATYQYKKPISSESGNFFYFKFYDSGNYQLVIKPEDGTENKITIKTNTYWYNYYVSSSSDKKYSFQIVNSGTYDVKMGFIDSSQEANLNLEKFLDLNFNTEEIYDNAPNPLIFNINVTQNTTLYFKANSGTFIESDSLLYYCIKDEKSECNFSILKSLTFEEGKAYKIKLNVYKFEKSKLYYKFQYFTFVKEVELGFILYNEANNDRYFMVKFEKYQTFYVYGDGLEYAFIYESQKNKLPDNLNDLFFRTGYANIKQINKDRDYFIFKNGYVNSKIFFYLFDNYFVCETYSEESFSIEREKYGLIQISKFYSYYSIIIASSNKNMALLNTDIDPKNLKNIIYKETSGDIYICLYPIKKSSSIRLYKYDSISQRDDLLFYKLITNEELNSYLGKYQSDYIFKRSIIFDYNHDFKTQYFFNIEEDYYLYIKKYYGFSNVYKYKHELNQLTNCFRFSKSAQFYDNSFDYKLINNELLIISGFQSFTLTMNYNSLLDFYIQKVDDYNEIVINQELYPTSSFIKLLNKEKEYSLKFTVDHLILLDKKFTNATVTFTDSKGSIYQLNKEKRILSEIKGDNIKVISTEKALLYFYKRMPNYSEKGAIIFDKSQNNKIMKLTLKNIKKNNLDIMLVKDFCFEGYYPMLQADSWEKVSSVNNAVTLYFENYYEKLTYEEDRNDEMKYIIYIFDVLDENNIPSFNSEDYTISDISYINNLLTPGNKYNFEVIQPDSKGSIVLNFKGNAVAYNILKCNSKYIKFKIENAKGYFDDNNYPFEETISENKYLNMHFKSDEILLYSFESDNEFLFAYNEDSSYGETNVNNFKILSIKQIEENVINLSFNGPYGGYNRFHIIIAKKDGSNNVNSFSNLCYVAKLMINNDDSIIVKTITQDSSYSIMTKIDISKLKPTENDRFIISIIDECLFLNMVIKYLEPIEFKLERKEAFEIKANEIISFDNSTKLFKFEYIKETDEEQILYISFNSREDFDIILYEPESDTIQKQSYDYWEKYNTFVIKKQGIYYIEFDGNIYSFLTENTFFIFISGNIIDRIDLSQRMYFNNLKIETKISLNPCSIKVNNLTEDRYVYFTYKIFDYYNSDLNNPYTICNDNTEECTSNIVTYKFLKNNNYTIHLNFIYEKNSYEVKYYFPAYFFFPIFEDTVEVKEEGFYSFKVPKIYVIDLKKYEKPFFYVTFKNQDKVYSSYIENSFSLEELNNYSLREIYYYAYYDSRLAYYYNNIVIIIIPEIGDNPTQFIIANNELSISKSGEYTIPAGKNAIIYFNIDKYSNNYYSSNYKSENYLGENKEEEEEDEDYYINPLTFFNRIDTFSSPDKNMILFSGLEVKEKKDFIIQNFFGFPIYIDKVDRNITLLIKSYEPKYAFFGVVNNELFKLYLQKIQSITEGQLSMVYDIRGIQLRLNSDFIPLSEFFNFYFFNMEDNVNLYIKQYYGFSELNEYNAGLIDLNDLSNLTKPLKNSEDLKPSFNKIINFKNDKFLTGYLGSNSYFEIYFEVDDNSTSIDLSQLMEETFKSTGRYIKKNIEYTINFTADHMAKLEYGDNAQVSIYDGNAIKATLDENKPTAEIQGKNLKIKSNNDALVYFYGKNILNQIEIENKIGYNLEIKLSGFAKYVIDFSFKGYNPPEIFTFSYNHIENGGTIYLENVYDKLKVKLAKGEKLYFYYISNGTAKMNYIPNLNHKNNDYTFNYIPKKSDQKTLIINNIIKEKIRYQVNFCGDPHKIKMYFQDAESSGEELLEFNDLKTVINYNITKLAHKLRFNSEKDFVFSYSFIDSADSLINDYKKWNKERKVLTDLTILNVTKKYPNDNTSDIFTIKFKPNYINSTTRYIIIIGSNAGDNSLDNLNNPCYITKLANEKPKGIKIVNVIDVGENDEIEENIDIYEILGRTDKYIINIISQELRFEKKLNYYNAVIFTHRISDKNEDENNDNKGMSSTYIIIFSIVGVIILLSIIFVLFKFLGKRNQNDINRQTKEIPNEKLLKDI